MTLLEALVAYCVNKGVLVGDGEDAFRDFMPEVPDYAVAFHEYKGDPMSPYSEHVHRSVQVKARAKTAEAARGKALQICNVFRSKTEDLRVDFSDSLWGQVYIRQTPFKLQQDESGRFTYCFNLGITTNILE